MVDSHVHTRGVHEEDSIAALVKRFAEQSALLSRQELRLAQLELAQKGKAVGTGAGILGAGALVAGFGLAAALSAVGAALAVVLPVWAAILVVCGILFGVAGVLALVGRDSLRRAKPPVPVATVETLRDDIETIKERVRR